MQLDWRGVLSINIIFSYEAEGITVLFQMQHVINYQGPTHENFNILSGRQNGDKVQTQDHLPKYHDKLLMSLSC